MDMIRWLKHIVTSDIKDTGDLITKMLSRLIKYHHSTIRRLIGRAL
jgi:hypothetical protein